MPTNTPNINIPKPLGTETVSRSAFNAIWDLIDGLFSHVSGHDHTTRGNLIPSAALAADVARANLLVNGGFEIAQRGPGPFTADGSWVADRWQMSLLNSTASITQITRTMGWQGKSLSAVYTHVGGGHLIIPQSVEWGNGQLRGRTVSASIKVRSSVAGTAKIALDDGIDATNSAFNIGTGEETLTVTKTLALGATALILDIVVEAASCTVEINDAMLCISTVPVDYVPEDPFTELARCLRYCWVVLLQPNEGLLSGWAQGTTVALFLVHFPVLMAVPPSMTVTATDWRVDDMAGTSPDVTVLTFDQPRTDGGRLIVTVAAGLTATRPYALSADGTAARVMIFEANPA